MTCLCFSPDAKILATSTLKGEIYFWNVETSEIEGVIDC
ncbi:MAG: hypothetical protein ACK52J_04130 [bacterium]